MSLHLVDDRFTGLGLEVSHLTKIYDRRKANGVVDLSFSVAPGQVVGLLGPNGAGKSTTLQCIAGWLRPDQGQIRWQGKLLSPTARVATSTFVPYTRDVYPAATVWEHMQFLAAVHGWRQWEGRAMELLERVGMVQERATLGRNLSDGMKAKLLLMGAWMVGSPLILLDEPLNGLDPRVRRECRLLLKELAARGCSVVISSHDIVVMEEICNYQLILQDGRVRDEGPKGVWLERGHADLEGWFLAETAG